MPSSYFGITGELGLYLDLLALFFFILWLALIAWTYVDAKRRIEDPVLIGCATAVSLYPYVGTLVYALLRPPEFLRDASERELEIRASILRVKRLENWVCLNCEQPIQATYQHCPKCRTRVKDPCRRCGKLVDRRWSFCPYCDTLALPVRPAKRVRLDRRRSGSGPSRNEVGESGPNPAVA
jgi:RNA polymerase subunit RPABC4/transcription elongation factor Spt4